MMLTPPTYVKRDGRQLRMDAVHRNGVFLTDNQYGGLILDITTGSVLQLNYHPIDLVRRTRSPATVFRSMGMIDFDELSAKVTLRMAELGRQYVTSLHKLSGVSEPCAVVPPKFIQLIEAFVKGVPTKELYQGAKTAFGLELPKMTKNYLNGGYLWEDSRRSLETFVLQAMSDARWVYVSSR